MKVSPKLVINVLTFCNDETPKRFEIMKEALPKLESLKTESTIFTLWDNNSSSEVKEFLETLEFIDYMHFSKNNLYDVAPIQFLAKAGKLLEADYVCHMEDDLLVFDENASNKLEAIMLWMDKHKDIGGSRILKWEVDNQKRYDKHGIRSEIDVANMQTHRNVISNESLKCEIVQLFDNDTNEDICRAVKTNWHWYNFPIVCKTDVYNLVVPNKDIEPLQIQEGNMMKSYNSLGLSLGALDGGIITHLAPPTPTSETSVRYHMIKKFQNKKVKNMGTAMPVIKMADAMVEVEKAIKGLEEFYEKS